MSPFTIHLIIRILQDTVQQWDSPIVSQVARQRNPYTILISTLLSLRTKDETTKQAAERLFSRVTTPDEMIALGEAAIADLIYPVGFYRNKARTIVDISRTLLENYKGIVPDDIDELLKLKGVGRKTANLVVTLGYGKPGICVDTHVHRICNRWGYVHTKTPEETEFALRKKLPGQYWLIFNDLLVTFGQNLCTPVSPFCSKCPIAQFCARVGVTKTR